jgi:flagella basal body P-ring formation protein FlgA
MTFPAKAIEGGQVGDSIRLINLRTKKRIKGTITDKGQVEYAQN